MNCLLILIILIGGPNDNNENNRKSFFNKLEERQVTEKELNEANRGRSTLQRDLTFHQVRESVDRY